MAQDKIRVMLSSRCNDPIADGKGGTITLTEVRRALKREIESEQVLGRKPFQVWINEDSPGMPANRDSWDTCLDQVRRCEILICIYNGNAGWASEDQFIGICQAELAEGLTTSPGKVFMVAMGSGQMMKKPGRRDDEFRRYVETQSLFRQSATDADELKSAVKNALVEAVVSLSKRGVREASRGKFHAGDALTWSRLNYADRASSISEAVLTALGGVELDPDHPDIRSLKLHGKSVCFAVSAIPDALSIGPAAEWAGRPHLNDHVLMSSLSKDIFGPVHVIGCHKTVTATQAAKMIGLSDALIVSAPFGLYAADNVQKGQVVLLKDCRDRTTTTHAVQRFLEWIRQSGEEKYLVERAVSRAKIVRVIAGESSIK